MKIPFRKIGLSIAILILIGIVGFIYVLPKVLVKLSREVSGSTAADFGLRYDKIEVLSHDSLILYGDFIYPFGREYNKETSAHSVIVLHPLKYNTKWVYPILKPLTTLDVNFITFDSRGHGRSEGHLYTMGVNEAKDVSQIIDHILSIYPDHSFGVYARSNTGNIALKAMESDKRIQYGIIENYDLHPIETIEKLNYDDVVVKNNILKNFLLKRSLNNLEINEKECEIDLNKIKQPVLLLQNEYNINNLEILEDKLVNAEVYKMYFPDNPYLYTSKNIKGKSYLLKDCLFDFIQLQASFAINNAENLYFSPLDSINYSSSEND